MTELRIGWTSDNRWDVITTIQSSDNSLTVMQISRDSGVDPGNVSKILDKFRNMGLVQKDIHGEHHLTENGQEVMTHLTKANEAMPEVETA